MAKSPFVSGPTTRKYVYPDPLAEDERDFMGDLLVDPEVLAGEDGGPLPDDERPWVRLRIPLSRGDQNTLAEIGQRVVELQADGTTSTRLPLREVNRHLFEFLVEGWSFGDGKPSADDYDKLADWSGVWINRCFADVQSRGPSRDFPRSAPNSSEPQSESPSESLAESVSA